jgi:DNA replication protein DnaC
MNNTNFTNSTFVDDGMYQQNNQFNNMGQNMLYNQILTMTIIPMITALVAKIVESFIGDIRGVFKRCVFWFEQKYGKQNLIQFKIIENGEMREEVLPLIWYINKTKSIRSGKFVSLTQQITDDDVKIQTLISPLELDINTSQSEESTQSDYNFGYRGGMSQTSNKPEKTNTSNLYTQINDGKTYYYGMTDGHFVIMSYVSSIEEIGNYVHEIISQYDEHMSDISKDIVKEKRIYIELYERQPDHSSAMSSAQINKDVLPLVWYMNNKRIITEGILLTNDKISYSPTFELGRAPNCYTSAGHMTNSPVDNSDEQTTEQGPSRKVTSNVVIMPFIDDTFQNNIKSSNNKKKDDGSITDNNHKKQSPDKKKVEIEKYIYCNFVYRTEEGRYGQEEKKIDYVVLSSKKYSIPELGDFLNDIKCQYDEHINNKNKVQYLYSLTSYEDGNKYSRLMLDTTQTFDHLFFEQKDQIIADLEKFPNKSYYERFGLKRKIGYLFVGPPGCGKTAIVSAITNKLGFSLKNIPISLLETNSQFETAYGDINIGGELVKQTDVVINFDEIDALTHLQSLKKDGDDDGDGDGDGAKSSNSSGSMPTLIINTSDKAPKQISKKSDKLNIGIILSKIDGNENQDGIVMCATCNDIQKFNEGLYRSGRFKLIVLSYVGRNEIKQMIEKYCEITLSHHQIDQIRNDKIIQTLDIKNIITSYLLRFGFDISPVDVDHIISEINSATN